MKKALSVILAVLMLFTLLSACTGSPGTGSTSAGTTKAGTTAGTTKANATTTATTAPPDAKRDQLSWFLGVPGYGEPPDSDWMASPYMQKFQELTNIDFEIVSPPYADVTAQLQLLIASMNICDITNCWHQTDIENAGIDGAFIDLEPLVRANGVLNGYYEDLYDLTRAKDGKIYYLKALPSEDPNAMAYRYDMLHAINGGKLPETWMEWYDIFDDMLAIYPDSYAFSARGAQGNYAVLGSMAASYGTALNTWVLYDGVYTPNIETPYHMELMQLLRDCYVKGYLSPTYITNTLQDFSNEHSTRPILLQTNNYLSIRNAAQGSFNRETQPDVNALYLPTRIPVSGLDVDPLVSEPTTTAIGWWGVCVSAKCKSVDAAIRMVEAATDNAEVLTMASWGLEDLDYTLVNGVKVSTEDEVDRKYRRNFLFRWSGVTEEFLEFQTPTIFAKWNEYGGTLATLEEYQKMVADGINDIMDAARLMPKLRITNFLVRENETLVRRGTEANELFASLTHKAIVGEITLQDYETQMKAAAASYKDVTDYYNSNLQEAIARQNFDMTYGGKY